MEAKQLDPSGSPSNGAFKAATPSALGAEAVDWEKDLSQVESKLSGFEKDITEQESTLADLLNKCDALLERLEEEVSGEGETKENDTDSDDKELEEEVKLLGKAMSANPAGKPTHCNQEFSTFYYLFDDRDAATVTCHEGSQPWFSIQLTEEAAFVAAGLETSDTQSDSGFLCEFCGNLIVQNDSFQVHRLNCCQSVATK